MALFEFDLAPTEEIVPWGTEGNRSLSWFALTDGWFRMPVGSQVLFQYTDEIMAHWRTCARDANYQIAAFVREMLGSVAAGAARLPEAIERLASNWDLLMCLQATGRGEDGGESDDDDVTYTAWRWLGERSPWASYLVANPKFQFVRIGGEVQIHWDNRDRVVDGIPVWTASHGVLAIQAETFCDECRGFADRLLAAMERRIADIEAGIARPQVSVSPGNLREQHDTWRKEFSSYFRDYEPDIDWFETERALRTIAERKGLTF